MGAPLAFLICSVGVAGLFYLNRDKSVRNSMALWLPVFWLWIVGSRPVSAWLGIGAGPAGALASTLDGSPMDAAVFGALMLAGIAVLFGRRQRTSAFLAVSGPIVIYFVYCLISIAWSPIHGPAFKRWTKAIGDLVMVLLIVTDAQPRAALQRLYSRVGFILLPFSIVLIRYTDMGRGYDPDGGPMNTGVTTNKNSLGLIAFVVSLGALWTLRGLLINKDAVHRGRRLVAQWTALVFGLLILQMAHSATSIACFIFGSGLMLATSSRAIRTRPGRVHALCLGIVLAGGLLFLFGGESTVTSALGRKSNLSGRTDIWAASLAAADNPIIGTGFESFWNVNVEKVARGLPGYWEIHNLVSAHNGYIQIYLDLGWIGVCLIALIIISGYRRAAKGFERDPELASLTLAYVTTATFYSITEAGFRTLSPSWFFLLLAVVTAGGVAAGLFDGESSKVSGPRGGIAIRKTSRSNVIPQKATVSLRGAGWPALKLLKNNVPICGAQFSYIAKLAATHPVR
jgi:exopolysaccharide production protein ExoQ